MSTPPQKVSLYSSNGIFQPQIPFASTLLTSQCIDLKNATDDALAPYLTNLPKPYTFKQEHYTTNIKLALGYTAVVIAGVLFYADWKLGWDATKAYTAPACVVYFVLNGFLTYWIWAVEAGTVFSGVREGGQRVCLLCRSVYTGTMLTLAAAYPSLFWEKALPRLQAQSDLLGPINWQGLGRQGDHGQIHPMV